MILPILDWCVILLGFFAAWLLFYRIPKLPRTDAARALPRVSIVIPARNEAFSLPLLLSDLSKQTLRPLEIICVDDASEDTTPTVAVRHGATLITLARKPQDWVGKSWACQNGADAAHGELLVFLDADVRLSAGGLMRIVSAYAEYGTLSVQPFHQTVRVYEQLSFFFNLVQIAANGTALPKPVNLGLYGPVVAISRADYVRAGGHTSVKDRVVEDMALGEVLRENGMEYRLFVGDADVSFRMYPGGFKALLAGWSKNLASGASKTPVWLFAAVFLWFASAASVPIGLLQATAAADGLAIALYSALYLLWMSIFFSLARRIGRFPATVVVFFPLSLLVFFAVFVYSGILRLFRLNTKWKGRAVSPDR